MSMPTSSTSVRAPWGIRLAGRLLLVLPLLEIFVIILVAHAIGGWATFLLIVAGSALGMWLVSREWGRASASLRASARTGALPERSLVDSVCVLAGGLFLTFPGFVSDLVGLFLVLPPTRHLLTRRLGSSIVTAPAGPGSMQATPRQPGRGDVIVGQVLDEGEIIDAEIIDDAGPQDRRN